MSKILREDVTEDGALIQLTKDQDGVSISMWFGDLPDNLQPEVDAFIESLEAFGVQGRRKQPIERGRLDPDQSVTIPFALCGHIAAVLAEVEGGQG